VPIDHLKAPGGLGSVCRALRVWNNTVLTFKRRKWNPEPSIGVGLWLYAPTVLVLIALLIYPVLRLFEVAMPDGFGLRSFVDYFENGARITALIVTFRVSAIVALLSSSMGFVLAWTLISTSSRVLKTAIWLAVMLPLLMGTVVKNYALLIILQRRGLFNTLLIESGLIDQPLKLLYNESAVVIGILYTLLPFAVAPIYTALLTVDFDLIRAAESMGATRFAAVRSIVLPLIWPALVSTTMLIFVIALGFYVVPVVLGGVTSPFIATLIQNDMEQFFDLKSAAVAALVLIALSTTAVAATLAWVGSDQVNRSATGS
jgi:ABC-type spermidine/putrescine transport system permease subunit I